MSQGKKKPGSDWMFVIDSFYTMIGLVRVWFSYITLKKFYVSPCNYYVITLECFFYSITVLQNASEFCQTLVAPYLTNPAL